MSNMPKFLNLGPEVTGDSAFSMYNLSLKEDWTEGKNFCHKLAPGEANINSQQVCSLTQTYSVSFFLSRMSGFFYFQTLNQGLRQLFLAASKLHDLHSWWGTPFSVLVSL